MTTKKPPTAAALRLEFAELCALHGYDRAWEELNERHGAELCRGLATASKTKMSGGEEKATAAQRNATTKHAALHQNTTRPG